MEKLKKEKGVFGSKMGGAKSGKIENIKKGPKWKNFQKKKEFLAKNGWIIKNKKLSFRAKNGKLKKKVKFKSQKWKN